MLLLLLLFLRLLRLLLPSQYILLHQVREDIDHRSYMPAAWRVDAYLNEEGEGQDEDDLASLRQHK